MFEHQLTMYAFNLQIAKQLAADVPADKFGVQVNGVGQTPRWIFGHLAVSTDFAAQMLGAKPLCDPAWHKAFGPGSATVAPGAPAPTKDQLLRVLGEGHERVAALMPGATAEAMSAPSPMPTFEGTPIRTVGDIVNLLTTVHEAYHLGQLSAWRRQMGFAPLF